MYATRLAIQYGTRSGGAGRTNRWRESQAIMGGGSNARMRGQHWLERDNTVCSIPGSRYSTVLVVAYSIENRELPSRCGARALLLLLYLSLADPPAYYCRHLVPSPAVLQVDLGGRMGALACQEDLRCGRVGQKRLRWVSSRRVFSTQQMPPLAPANWRPSQYVEALGPNFRSGWNPHKCGLRTRRAQPTVRCCRIVVSLLYIYIGKRKPCAFTITAKIALIRKKERPRLINKYEV